MADQPDDGRVGTRFGRYEIRALLTQSGVGQLYQALDTANNRAVALILLPPSADRQRFLTELPVVARTADPHLTPVHDWGEIDGVCYVATALTPGETLRSLLSTFGPMSPQRAVAIIEQVAAALDAARAHRLIHRDVRPENIVVTDDDTAYLLGFGVADPELSAPRPTAGSYAYTAPERFDNAPPSTRADVYSLACVLTELLTGDRPYPAASTVGQVIKAHLTAAPPKPSLIRPQGIPRRFDAVIARGMAKNPQHRYATAGDLAHAAREALSAQAVADHPTMVGRASDLAAVAAKRRPPQRVSQPAPEPDSYPDCHPDFYSESYPDEVAEPASQRSKLLTLALAVVVVLVLTAAGIVVWRLAASHGQPPGSTKAAPTAYRATILPFTGLTGPEGVAVDSVGSVYVTNIENDRVVKLPPDSTKQTVLPFVNLKEPYGLAVDKDGGVYVGDTDNDRVVKLAAGSTSQTVLPFSDLKRPEGLAVGKDGNVYVVDTGNDRVVQLAAGSTTQTVLPFNDLERPKGVAVDKDGSVYVADTGNNRVLKLAPGSTSQTVLPFTGLRDPSGLAVDESNSLYVTDGSRVVRLNAGATKQVLLPVPQLNYTHGVAVDGSGNIYVSDYGNDQVVKLVAS
jgi:serine/threonine protein kinase, bacterial